MNGVLFDGMHSYDDFNLLLIKKEISPPEPKVHRVDVPMRNGSIDLTEILNEDVKYNDRKISLSFEMIEPVSTWASKISTLENALHGKKMNIIMEDDSMYYYVGRVNVNKWTSEKTIGKIEIECIVDPYKYDLGANWLWNPFNFDEDVINEINELEVVGTAVQKLTARRKNTYPTITSTSEMTVTFKGTTYDVHVGVNKIYDLLLDEGENELVFTGNGTITIDYIGGSL